MNKLRKYIEITFFIGINLVFGFSIIVFVLDYFFMIILYNIPREIIPTWKQFNEIYFLVHIMLFMLYLFLKIFLFPIIYSTKKFLPITTEFFNKIFATRKSIFFVFLLLFVLLLLDSCFLMYFCKQNIIQVKNIEFILGLGLLPSYIVMLLYLKLSKAKITKEELDKC